MNFLCLALQKLDFVFTVCDNAAKEVCPIWPGQPMTAHWGVPDPAAVHGSEAEVERAFREAFFILERRISLLLCLPLKTLDSPCTQEGTRQHRPDHGPRHPRIAMGFGSEATLLAFRITGITK